MCKGCKNDSGCNSNVTEVFGGEDNRCPFFEPADFFVDDRLTVLRTQQYPASVKSADLNAFAIDSILPDSIRYAQ